MMPTNAVGGTNHNHKTKDKLCFALSVYFNEMEVDLNNGIKLESSVQKSKNPKQNEMN